MQSLSPRGGGRGQDRGLGPRMALRGEPEGQVASGYTLGSPGEAADTWRDEWVCLGAPARRLLHDYAQVIRGLGLPATAEAVPSSMTWRHSSGGGVATPCNLDPFQASRAWH